MCYLAWYVNMASSGGRSIRQYGLLGRQGHLLYTMLCSTSQSGVRQAQLGRKQDRPRVFFDLGALFFLARVCFFSHGCPVFFDPCALFFLARVVFFDPRSGMHLAFPEVWAPGEVTVQRTSGERNPT